jgi:hemerythrin-like domain-containing protein
VDDPTSVDPKPELHQPIRHFCGSHENIVGGLHTLEHLPELAASLARAREAAAATLALFDKSVLRHHAEEEQELFVSVQRSCRDARECHQVRSLVDRLTSEHRRIEAMWARLRPAVALTAMGKVHRHPAFDDEIRTLVELYFAHARLEEEAFLPLADEILGRNANHMAALGVALHMRHVPTPAAYI